MKLFYFLFLPWLLLLCFFPIQIYAANEPHTDHPLVAAYQGSKIYKKQNKEFDEYQLFKGYDKQQKSYLTETLEGKITQLLYVNPAKRSTLEIFRNYKLALNDKGAEIVYECNQAKNRQCMDQYVGASLRTTFNINSIYNKSGRYMIANLKKDEHKATLVIGVGDKYTDVHIVEMRAMETDKVTFDLDSMNSDLKKRGFVIIQGLYFDSNKTTLKPSSNDALKMTAELLSQKSKLEFLVVGHTDSQGNLNYNMDLSKGRATAVMSSLIKDYGIEPSRLSAHGVASMAPIASNADAKGMAKNRRVVLVQKN